MNLLIEKVNSSYDGFNQLKQIEKIKAGERVTVNYTYNGDGLRTQKIVRSSKDGYTEKVTNYLYDRQHVILETDASDSITVRYIRGVNYIARMDSTDKLSYYLYNGHGDVVHTVSAEGVIENQYDYDIFGSPTLSIEQYGNAIRYAGEFLDEETGLYYLRARYYDPYTGRFMSQDSYWGEDTNPLSLNLYTYGHNNPIMYVDPSGHSVYGVIADSNMLDENTSERDSEDSVYGNLILPVKYGSFKSRRETEIRRETEKMMDLALEAVYDSSKKDKEKPVKILSAPEPEEELDPESYLDYLIQHRHREFTNEFDLQSELYVYETEERLQSELRLLKMDLEIARYVQGKHAIYEKIKDYWYKGFKSPRSHPPYLDREHIIPYDTEDNNEFVFLFEVSSGTTPYPEYQTLTAAYEAKSRLLYFYEEYYSKDLVKEAQFKTAAVGGDIIVPQGPSNVPYPIGNSIKGEATNAVKGTGKGGQGVNRPIDEFDDSEIYNAAANSRATEGTGNLVFKSDYDDHLINVKKFDRDPSKGITGGHNMDEFYNYFRNVLKLDDVDFINKVTPHPTIDGIIEINYKIPKLDNKGNLTGEYKYFKNPKTVYDPSKISEATIIEWGKAAMQQGIDAGSIVGRKITGIAPNGLKFEGYMDANGVITNFYPKLD